MIKEKKNVFTNNTFYKLKFLSETKTKGFETCNVIVDYYFFVEKVVVSIGKSSEASSQQIPTTQIQ